MIGIIYGVGVIVSAVVYGIYIKNLFKRNMAEFLSAVCLFSIFWFVTVPATILVATKIIKQPIGRSIERLFYL